MQIKDNIDYPFVDITHYDIIPHLIHKLSARSYLEIGCAGDACFSSVDVPRKVGVDPDRGGTHRMTSDEFFSQNTEKFDLIFVDGMHKYEQVLKDVDNAFACLEENGIVVMHDVLPSNRYSAVANKKDKKKGIVAWNGDVWRTAFDLVQRADVSFYIVPCLHGVGLISKRPNRFVLDIQPENNWEFFYSNWHRLPKLMSLSEINRVLLELTS